MKRRLFSLVLALCIALSLMPAAAFADEACEHTVIIDQAVSPTCEKAGKTAGSHCEVCGKVLKAQETIPALCHEWGEWQVIVPRCIEGGGVEVRKCARCGATEKRNAYSNDHADDPFSDVYSSGYHDYIVLAKTVGIIDGYPDGSYRPNKNVTRAQFIKMLYNAFGEKTDGELKFRDAARIESVYKDAVIWGVKNEIIMGYKDNTFRPSAEITRAQMATYIHRYLISVMEELSKREAAAAYKDPGFKDADEIAKDYVDSVNCVANCGFMNGVKDNMFAPNATANRGMSATVILRLYDALVSAVEGSK